MKNLLFASLLAFIVTLPFTAHAGENSDDGVILPISQETSFYISQFAELPVVVLTLFGTAVTPAEDFAVHALERSLYRVGEMLTPQEKAGAIAELETKIRGLKGDEDIRTISARAKKVSQLSAELEKIKAVVPVTPEAKRTALAKAGKALEEVRDLLRQKEFGRLPVPLEYGRSAARLTTSEGIKALRQAKSIRTVALIGESLLALDVALRIEETGRKAFISEKEPVSAVPLISEPVSLYRHVSSAIRGRSGSTETTH